VHNVDWASAIIYERDNSSYHCGSKTLKVIWLTNIFIHNLLIGMGFMTFKSVKYYALLFCLFTFEYLDKSFIKSMSEKWDVNVEMDSSGFRFEPLWDTYPVLATG
jgi:hypothetical protein